ncbi:alpha-ketoglutarate-dependent dioxygenase AlkB family protein [Planktothricoides raciborskii]|uniref:Alpha-ketoglutarate-dependent dioxygenase AlkB n=1 Tax=Planktothricoides raciborskii FACHB-1370 TaxID=2949576 RepID=A0ABR8EN97_9CYAN|nr:alpha-ketoglutarate-dependent dioxygenase AlkB [Planktothricoides raciborskii]MBD2547559.1 alpha-ketoglutarate-dependent dioxygenase AlkB [Planktothricoides raciborskii FACHB-1370]MBD2586036.1 alpha-ketoglutarate-dependent dioxygenase AlkB [Planktothricoides raciborskii FACHB-1261]
MHHLNSNIIGQKLELYNAEVIFYPRLFHQPESHQLFTDLLNQISWKHEPIKIFGKSVLQPRLTAYYGTKAYTYSGVTMQPLPWNAPLLQIKEKIEPLVNTQFNGVLLNLYRDGQDYMGWHSDDEKELVKGGAIASLSLGETRRFIFRRKDNHQIKFELKLADGDFLVMGGDPQKFWQHYVPKSPKVTHPRINLTFRMLA